VIQPHLLDGLYPHQVPYARSGTLDPAKETCWTAARRTGKTRTAARKKFFRALDGHDQVITSVSKRQAMILKPYMQQISKQEFGVDLTGNDEIPIHTSKGTAMIRFCTPNESLIQGYDGDFTYDECGWSKNFEKVNDAAKQCAGQDRFIRDYITTASTLAHPAYNLMNGLDRSGKAYPNTDERGRILYQDEAVMRVCLSTTLPEAIKLGYDLFNWDHLVEENPSHVIDQFYLLKWINDHDSFFKLKELQKLQRDPEELEALLSPINDVLWGDDPSRNGDDAFLTGLQLNARENLFVKFKQLKLQKQTFKQQAQQIAPLFLSNNSKFLGVDIDGIGVGVYDELIDLGVTPELGLKGLRNDPVAKSRRIVNLKQLTEAEGWRYATDDIDLTSSLLAICQTTTDAGNKMTFKTKRSGSNHGDSGHSLIYALDDALSLFNQRHLQFQRATVNSNQVNFS